MAEQEKKKGRDGDLLLFKLRKLVLLALNQVLLRRVSCVREGLI